MLGFDFLGRAVHLLMVVAAVAVFASSPPQPKWRSRALAVVTWLVLSGIDVAISKGFVRADVFATYAVALGIPLAASVGAVTVSRKMKLTRRWQAVAGTAAGIVTMLPWPVFLVVFGCWITHECL